MDLFKMMFKGDKVIWMIYLLFCVISFIEVFSASSTLTYKSGDHWGPITGHFVLMVGGAIIVWIVHRLPIKTFNLGVVLVLPLSWILLGIVLGLSAVNGARRWIDLGFFQFQPSELAKLGLILIVAKILAMAQGEDGAHKSAFKYILILTGITCGLIVTENLSTCIIIAITIFAMMIMGRIPWKQIGMLLLVCFSVGFLGFITIKYVPSQAWEKVGLNRMVTWQKRFERFNDEKPTPDKFDLDVNAQEAHASIAIVNSGGLGKGPGNSIERDFLSQAFSDFIFAIIIEELGLGGAALVIFLYILLLRRILRIVKQCDKTFLVYLATGIGVVIVIQALINIAVAVGRFPVTGQPLPFISKGGTSIMISAVYIGILLNISRYIDEKNAEQLTADEAIDEETADQ